MDILKLNRTIVIILIFILFGCNIKENNNCKQYVASGDGFWISFANYKKKYSEKDFKHLKIYVKNREVKYAREDLGDYLYTNNYNIGLSQKILLKDTITIKIKDEIIKMYNFSNIIEEGFDQSHKKNRVCRYCSSTINNRKLKDQGNNIITVDFDKL